jgi:hypothetical protein
VIKTAKLLARNKEMKLHTAAKKASCYTTGASPEANTRRLVKRFKIAVHKYLKTRGDKDDAHLIEDEFITLSYSDRIILEESGHFLIETGHFFTFLLDTLSAFERGERAALAALKEPATLAELEALVERGERTEQQHLEISQRPTKKTNKQRAREASRKQWYLKVISDLDFEIDMIRINRPEFFDALVKANPE